MPAQKKHTRCRLRTCGSVLPGRGKSACPGKGNKQCFDRAALATTDSNEIQTNRVLVLRRAAGYSYLNVRHCHSRHYVARFARSPCFFRLLFSRALWGLNLGVALLTRFVSRQYSPLSSRLPHGFPVDLLTQRSLDHRRREDPALVFLTFPWAFLHFANAWEALADGQTAYCALTFR